MQFASCSIIKCNFVIGFWLPEPYNIKKRKFLIYLFHMVNKFRSDLHCIEWGSLNFAFGGKMKVADSVRLVSYFGFDLIDLLVDCVCKPDSDFQSTRKLIILPLKLIQFCNLHVWNNFPFRRQKKSNNDKISISQTRNQPKIFRLTSLWKNPLII